MKRLSLFFVWLLTLTAAAQTNRQITISENIAYRTDVGKSTVLDLAQPQFGPQKDRPAILIIHGGGWNAGSKNDGVYQSLMRYYAQKGYVVGVVSTENFGKLTFCSVILLYSAFSESCVCFLV